MNHLFDIPFHEGFQIDIQGNIHIISENKIIPLSLMKFRWNGKTLYTVELYNLTFYGVKDPINYKMHSKIDSESILVNNIKFKKIPIHLDGYYISDFGAVYSLHRNRLRKLEIDRDGYIRISFPYNNMTHMAIHRLVYAAWVGKIPEGYVIDHIDNIKWNNHYTNLQAITFAENSRKAATDGLYKSSIDWNEEKVQLVCEMMEANYSIKDIAAKFNITPQDHTLYKNFRNQLYNFRKHQRSWIDITSKFNFDNYDGFLRPDSKYRDSEILEMRELYAAGYSMTEIADIFHTNLDNYLSKLIRGKKRKKIKLYNV